MRPTQNCRCSHKAGRDRRKKGLEVPSIERIPDSEDYWRCLRVTLWRGVTKLMKVSKYLSVTAQSSRPALRMLFDAPFGMSIAEIGYAWAHTKPLRTDMLWIRVVLLNSTVVRK